MYDVIVVGAGPAGSAAAKKCAEGGMKTLLLEKGKVPRFYMGAGQLISQFAQRIVTEEFGTPPPTVLATPPLVGWMFYVPGVKPRKVEHEIPHAWRSKLDFWMNQKAQEAGAEFKDGANVTGVIEGIKGYSVQLEREGEKQEIQSRYLIGADGTGSLIRKCLFPGVRFPFIPAFQEYHQGELDLDKNYFHKFHGYHYEYFSVHYKDDGFLICCRAKKGEVKRRMEGAKQILAKEFGFNLKSKPRYRKGRIAEFSSEVLSYGTFSPAKGNALMAGDVSGFRVPFHGEGIGTAILTGRLAARSIAEAMKAGKEAEGFYLQKMEELERGWKDLVPPSQELREASIRVDEHLADMLAKTFAEVIKKQLTIPL